MINDKKGINLFFNFYFDTKNLQCISFFCLNDLKIKQKMEFLLTPKFRKCPIYFAWIRTNFKKINVFWPKMKIHHSINKPRPH